MPLCPFSVNSIDCCKRISRFAALFSPAGIADIIADPGFGFSKNLDQNYNLLAHLGQFRTLECPLLVGISRKSMATRLLGITADEALNATTVLNTLALERGAAILRVHDPAPALEAIKIYLALLNNLS